MEPTLETRARALRKLETLAPTFASVAAPLYRKLRWNWREGRVPTRLEILQVIRQLIAGMLRDPELTASESGGIRVYTDEEGAYLAFIKEYAVFWGDADA